MILAVDLGSTTFKAALFDSALRRCGQGSAHLQYSRPASNRVELEGSAVDTALQTAIDNAMDDAGTRPNTLRAVAITSQAQTFCRWRAHVSSTFLSWQDESFGYSLPVLETELPDEVFAEHTSFSAKNPKLLISKLFGLCHQEPLHPAERIVHLPEYFVWQITGQHVLDRNLAAMSGLYSLVSQDWWSAALATVGLTRNQLPFLADVGLVAAHTIDAASRYGLPTSIPVFLAGNDQTAGAYGVDIHSRDSTLITLGTAQAAYQYSAARPPPKASLIRGAYPGGGYYQMWAGVCGSIVTWAHQSLAGGTPLESLFALAEDSPADCDGLTFVADPSTGTGDWPQAKIHHTPANRARAVLDSLCRALAHGVSLLPPTQDYLLAGGGTQSALWCEMIADALGHSITIVRASPLEGAAHLAACALGAKA